MEWSTERIGCDPEAHPRSLRLPTKHDLDRDLVRGDLRVAPHCFGRRGTVGAYIRDSKYVCLPTVSVTSAKKTQYSPFWERFETSFVGVLREWGCFPLIPVYRTPGAGSRQRRPVDPVGFLVVLDLRNCKTP